MSPIVKTTSISAKPETLQVYSFASNDGHYDQLVMKASRKLKEDVSNSFPCLFLEKKLSKLNTKMHMTLNRNWQLRELNTP